MASGCSDTSVEMSEASVVLSSWSAFAIVIFGLPFGVLSICFALQSISLVAVNYMDTGGRCKDVGKLMERWCM
jgi:hypothetical protein